MVLPGAEDRGPIEAGCGGTRKRPKTAVLVLLPLLLLLLAVVGPHHGCVNDDIKAISPLTLEAELAGAEGVGAEALGAAAEICFHHEGPKVSTVP